jgi:hypothetical protein
MQSPRCVVVESHLPGGRADRKLKTSANILLLAVQQLGHARRVWERRRADQLYSSRLGLGRYGESVPLLLIDRGREESGPYPTSARDPHQRGPNQDTARTESKVLERSLPADCIQLARLQNRSIANQEKALRNKPRRCSIRQSHHHRGTEIRDQVFCVPAECCSCHGVRRQPGESCESNDAANEGCFPKQGDRRLYGCSAQCRVHVVHRSRHCRRKDFQ